MVFFLGVLYHLRHPLLALEIVCGLTTEVAIVESFVIDAETWKEHQNAIPTMEFYETFELGNQYDNWNGPTVACLLAMCRAAGFARVELMYAGGQLRRCRMLPQVGTASGTARGRTAGTALRVQRPNARQLFLQPKIGRVSRVRFSIARSPGDSRRGSATGSQRLRHACDLRPAERRRELKSIVPTTARARSGMASRAAALRRYADSATNYGSQ